MVFLATEVHAVLAHAAHVAQGGRGRRGDEWWWVEVTRVCCAAVTEHVLTLWGVGRGRRRTRTVAIAVAVTSAATSVCRGRGGHAPLSIKW